MTKFSPQIITPNLWAAVQQAMNSRRRPGPLWDYQFSGFFSCAECGSNIVGATIQYRGQKYPYYRCSGTVARDGKPRICPLKAYRAGDLEPLLWEHIYEAVENPTLIFDEIRANVSGPSEAVGRQVFELERSINKALQEESTLVMQRTKEIINQRMLERLIIPITNHRCQLEDELSLLLAQRSLVDNVDQAEEVVSIALAGYRQGLREMDSEARQRLLRLLGIRLTGRGRTVLVTGVIDPSLFTIGQTLA